MVKSINKLLTHIMYASRPAKLTATEITTVVAAPVAAAAAVVVRVEILAASAAPVVVRLVVADVRPATLIEAAEVLAEIAAELGG